MKTLQITDLNLTDQRVLIRVDFNVPLHADGSIADDTRLRACLPTIQYVLDHGGSVILMSHLGRPEGNRNPKLSLSVCAKALSLLLSKEIIMAPDCIGKETEQLRQRIKPGQILLLENLRFHQAEEHPDKDLSFAKALAKHGDIYINDAFATAHRNHASTSVITQYFPGKAAAGLLMGKEIEALTQILVHPIQPFYAIIGGAKVSSKIGALRALVAKAQGIFIGGGMCYTFMHALGKPIGDSLCEKEQIDTAKQFIDLCQIKQVPLFFPHDLVIANAFTPDAQIQNIKPENGIPSGWQGMDIGPITCTEWARVLENAKTIFWNGPLGVFEFPRFAQGTFSIAQSIAKLSSCHSVIGGGDSLAAIHQLGIGKAFTHLSTGGGATLEFIELGTLPGIEALSEKIQPLSDKV
ncbi:MAG: phosphoglycerate kinase [Chlamydiia bacterium]